MVFRYHTNGPCPLIPCENREDAKRYVERHVPATQKRGYTFHWEDHKLDSYLRIYDTKGRPTRFGGRLGVVI